MKPAAPQVIVWRTTFGSFTDENTMIGVSGMRARKLTRCESPCAPGIEQIQHHQIKSVVRFDDCEKFVDRAGLHHVERRGFAAEPLVQHPAQRIAKQRMILGHQNTRHDRTPLAASALLYAAPQQKQFLNLGG